MKGVPQALVFQYKGLIYPIFVTPKLEILPPFLFMTILFRRDATRSVPNSGQQEPNRAWKNRQTAHERFQDWLESISTYLYKVADVWELGLIGNSLS